MSILSLRRPAGSSVTSTQQKLVETYKSDFGLAADSPLTYHMIREHFETEKGYRTRLLNAARGERTAIFEACYTELYARFPWLNQTVNADDRVMDYMSWGQLLPKEPQDIYEIGSGDGGLARYLAELGHRVTATEITSERGRVLAADANNLRWATTDGVNLMLFEAVRSYSAIVSNQVIEHLHPEDLPIHLHQACSLLKPGGCYILATPHRAVGPSDIGRVFGKDELLGMHLREYSYAEVEKHALAAGFRSVEAVLRIPRKARRLFPNLQTTFASRTYLRYLKLVEGLLASLPTQRTRRKVTRMLRLALFSDNLFVILRKG